MGSGLFTPTHLIFLFLLALLLFGAKRLPEIGRSLGVGMREFKESVTGQDKPEDAPQSQLPPPAPAASAPPAQDAAPAAPASEQRETESVS